jgi:hypothetical protein
LAASALGDMMPVEGYDLWQWNGFSRWFPPVASSAAAGGSGSAARSAAADSQVSQSGGTVKFAGYNAWQGSGSGGSPSYASAPATASESASALSSSSLFPLVSPTANDALISAAVYQTWQWNGFQRSSPMAALTAPATVAAASPLLSASSGGLAASSLAAGGTASLSGYIFVDVNSNDGAVTTADWAIIGAKIALTRDSDPPIIGYTNANGAYSFSGLLPGTYAITMLTPCSLPGQDRLGYLRDASGNPVSTGAGTASRDKFSDIVLLDGYTGVGYDFAELAYPINLISKRLLLNDSEPIPNIPEPSSLVVLATAALSLAAFLWRRGAPR